MLRYDLRVMQGENNSLIGCYSTTHEIGLKPHVACLMAGNLPQRSNLAINPLLIYHTIVFSQVLS